MVNFENVLPILKEQYNRLQPEILRFDFQYNGYHIYFLYKPTLIEDGKDLFVFNAYVDNIFICQPLNFIKNILKTRIAEDIYLTFWKICPSPDKFFSEVNTKIIESTVNFMHSNLNEMNENFNAFHQQFPDLEFDKPYFWRFTSLPKGKNMSSEMEKKLRISCGLSSKIIFLLKKSRRTAQFTLNPQREKSIKIAVLSLEIDN
ncbi:hypothetical protein [Fusobacterium ulcerans]|uniref:hypothetical protein n=1 Tax=Fusobacterium ulcerans TaxID=861 RepID=UPI00267247ED|nr:hypothetical protein [Fusobacterium ulcerans]